MSTQQPTVAAAFSPLAAEGLVGLSAPVAFELGYAARSPSDFRALSGRLSSFTPVPTTDADHRRQRADARAGAGHQRHLAVELSAHEPAIPEASRSRASDLPSSVRVLRSTICQRSSMSCSRSRSGSASAKADGAP